MKEHDEYVIKMLQTLKNKFAPQRNYSATQIHLEIDLMMKRCERR